MLGYLGPGFITGASDDDPSGIATYAQAGAQFGYGMLWTLSFTLPLMTAVQEASARIGIVASTCGLGGNLPTAATLGPDAAMRLGNWTYAALANANEALTTWHAWLEAGRPSEADLV